MSQIDSERLLRRLRGHAGAGKTMTERVTWYRAIDIVLEEEKKSVQEDEDSR